MLRLPLCLLPLAALAVTPALHATSFNYSLTLNTPGSTAAVSGTIAGPADPLVPGAFDINTLSGAASEYTFSGIVTSNTNSGKTATLDGFTFDNVLYTAGTHLVDQYGLLVDLTSPAGTSLAHVFYQAGATPGYEVDVVDPNDPGDITPFTVANFNVSSAATPEPGTLTLLGSGLLALAAIGRRRRQAR